jgi:radical SAM enzyme (TIGR01210 family)
VQEVYPEQAATAWITRQRPARTAVLDAQKPHGFFLEQERTEPGTIIDCATILLTNKECPWRCLMCDLWKQTLERAVPAGAIPAQIEYALDRLGGEPEQVKLYNSGSFFDRAAIPESDYKAIAEKVRFAKRVVVESHPRLVGEKALRLRDLLEGSLEVAMGLETVHPEALRRLNKKFTLDQFGEAALFLKTNGISLRVFLLVHPPFLREAEAMEWLERAIRFAFGCGATVVSLIPTRGGKGAMQSLQEEGHFRSPRLSDLERGLLTGISLQRGRVFADTWNLEEFSQCATCFAARKRRIEGINLSQKFMEQNACPDCKGT